MNPSPTQTNRPMRPFGLTLALIAIGIVFVIFPLIEVVFVVLLNQTLTVSAGQGISGIDVLRLPIPALVVQGGISACVCVCILLAWRGWPAFMQWLLPFVVVLIALAHTVVRVGAWVNAQDFWQSGATSGDGWRDVLTWGYVVLVLMIALYTTWFCQRWSSRAFFRRAYTPQDIQRLAELTGA